MLYRSKEFIKKGGLIIYSPGGSRFIVPCPLPISKVFPMEEGIIICAQKDANMFPEISCYFTLLGHPLNELNPLGKTVNDHIDDMINSNVN
jgi:hypothetical protein